MAWQRLGRVFVPCEDHPWMRSHAQVPVVDTHDPQRVRVYFSTRDDAGRSQAGFVDLDPTNVTRVIAVSTGPVLQPGALGCFDDSGVMPSFVIPHRDKLLMYYTGWNQGVTVPYRNSIGLAVSHDGGDTFTRLFDGPILDRCATEPHFCAAPWVSIENSVWRMWYLSCVGWLAPQPGEPPEARYHIKYAESPDGISWDRRGTVAVDFDSAHEGGLVRPTVIRNARGYEMWFARRGFRDYRGGKGSYRLGYARSRDGIRWERDDLSAGLAQSSSGWDSTMLAYPYVAELSGGTYMFYNGNQFGRTGFGVAIRHGN